MAQKTNDKIKQFEQIIAELENKWKRALADYANLEKRVTKEKEEFVKFANAQLIDKLLAVFDNLKLCQQHSKDKGLQIACDQFEKILRTEGVEKILTADQNFDPETMDTIEIVSGPKNKVMKVVSEGYKLNGEVIRPARVQVGDGRLKEKDKQTIIKDYKS